MQIKRNILLLSLFLFSAFSVAHSQDNDKNDQIFRKTLGKAILRFDLDSKDAITKSELLMIELNINASGKIDSYQLVNKNTDTTFKRSLEASLDKLKEVFSFQGVKPGLYPILLCFVYGDDVGTFNIVSMTEMIGIIYDKYRGYENEPLVLIRTSLPTRTKN